MSADRRQYDISGTKTSWRKWKRDLKKSTSRLLRRKSKCLLEDTPKKVTGGWAS
jgi:hypothetical protein